MTWACFLKETSAVGILELVAIRAFLVALSILVHADASYLKYLPIRTHPDPDSTIMLSNRQALCGGWRNNGKLE